MASMPTTTAGAFVAGGLAACGAVTASHPFETVKIRMQLQGELVEKGHQPQFYRGPIHGVRVIAQNEGIAALYRGIGAAYIYQVLLNGCRLGFYEPMRANVCQHLWGDRSAQNMTVNVMVGGVSGIMGAAAASPFFLIKTRVQNYSPHLPVGTQHHYRNWRHGLATIFRTEGVRGLYRGAWASMVRTGAGSAAQLPSYFWTKDKLVKWLGMHEGPTLHLTSSAVSGFFVCLAMHPPDTIMSRLYNQNGNLYSGWIDCVTKTVRTEGLLAIYKGFLPHLMRVGPHTVIMLTLAEQTNKFVRGIEDRLRHRQAMAGP